jgi:hypothetical protein
MWEMGKTASQITNPIYNYLQTSKGNPSGVDRLIGMGKGMYGLATETIPRAIKTGVQDPSKILPAIGNYVVDNPVNSLLAVSGGASVLGKGAELANMARTANVAGKVAELTNPITMAAKGIPIVAKPIVGGLGTIGMTTGRGAGFVEEAVKSGESFKKAMRGNLTGEEVVDHAKSALGEIVNERGSQYKTRLSEVSKNKEPIDLQPLKDAVTEDLKKFVRYNEPQSATSTISKPSFTAVPEKYEKGGQFTIKTGEGKYMSDNTGTPVFYQTEDLARQIADRLNNKSIKQTASGPERKGEFDWERTSVGSMKKTKKGWSGTGDVKDLKDMYDQIMKWGSKPEDITPMGLDMLKRNLDQFYSPKSDVRAFTTSARNKVKDLIVKNVPEYAEMTKGYSEASNLIKDIESNLMIRKEGCREE